MANTIAKDKNKYHQCSVCKFNYKDKLTAKECESWCKEHNSCNMKITKKAINI